MRARYRLSKKLAIFGTPEPVVHRIKLGLRYGWRLTVCGKDTGDARVVLARNARGRFCEVCFRR